MKRDWIQKGEGKLTYVQVFGFFLIALGVLYLASFLLPSGVINYMPSLKLDDEPTAYGISIAFFSTMLGVAFAFPDMLKGQTKDISTMRIVVFMLVNVICMLLLKIGWGKSSLTEIGLDGYWMGVIGFLFGAKVTQAVFENAKYIFPRSPQAGSDTTDLSNIEISRLAVIQNRDELLARYSNIESVSDTLKDGRSCVTIYLKDNQAQSVPNELPVTLRNGSIIKVQTEIVPDAGGGIPHIGQTADELSDSNSPGYYGSICCIVDSLTNPDFRGVVTSGHVFTYGDFYDYGGVLGPHQKRNVLINGHPTARLFLQQMKFNQDIAILELIDKENLQKNYTSFSKGFYDISEVDVNPVNPNITVLSRQDNRRDGFILDYNVSFEVKYVKTSRYMRNIILIGSTNDRTTSQPLSVGGDSGSCVFHKESGKLIGMLLGGNKKFSFVLPLQQTLSDFNFKPL